MQDLKQTVGLVKAVLTSKGRTKCSGCHDEQPCLDSLKYPGFLLFKRIRHAWPHVATSHNNNKGVIGLPGSLMFIFIFSHCINRTPKVKRGWRSIMFPANKHHQTLNYLVHQFTHQNTLHRLKYVSHLHHWVPIKALKDAKQRTASLSLSFSLSVRALKQLEMLKQSSV